MAGGRRCQRRPGYGWDNERVRMRCLRHWLPGRASRHPDQGGLLHFPPSPAQRLLTRSDVPGFRETTVQLAGRGGSG
jgi:hypothetical protein